MPEEQQATLRAAGFPGDPTVPVEERLAAHARHASEQRNNDEVADEEVINAEVNEEDVIFGEISNDTIVVDHRGANGDSMIARSKVKKAPRRSKKALE